MRLQRFALPLCGILLVVSVAAAEKHGPIPRLSADEQHRFQNALDAFRAGEWREAAGGFHALLGGSALLADYARFLLAESLHSLGDLSGARRLAESIAREHPDSSLVPRALLRLATVVSRQGDEPAGEAILRRFLSEFAHRPEATKARYLLGLSLEVQDRGGEAAAVFRELWLVAPASAYGQAAGDRLERLERAGSRLPAPTVSERLDRAERLLADGMPAAARDEALAVAGSGGNAEVTLRALRVVAGAWQRLGRYGRAALAIERALLQAPLERRPDLLLELARVQERAGASGVALGTVDRLLRDHPAAREVPGALLLRGRIFEASGKPAEAEAAYRRVAREFTRDEAAGAALWQLGWHAFIRGDLEASAWYLSELAELPVAQGYRLPAAYWAGRSHEAVGERSEARRLYLIPLREAPRSYYGLLAARRVDGAKIGPGNLPAPPLPSDPLTSLAGDRRIARAEALRAIGLVEFAAAELEQFLAGPPDDLGKLYGVSAVYVRNEQYHLALRILRRHFADLARSGSPMLPRAFWEMFYPIGWARELREASARAGLDPHLVAAVVREESSFFPLARSRVGARGLMQLMPETARPMAARQRMAFGQGELLDAPAVNLQMGTAFLAGLLKEFGEPRLAAAAYNAGPARVRKWWAARRSDDVEVFVEQIPFDETRHFVKRVMVAWEEYRRIWGERASIEEARR